MKLHQQQAHQVTWIYTLDCLNLRGLFVCKPNSFEYEKWLAFNQKNEKSKGSSMSMWNKT